jgi:hypothetical protein
MSEDLRIESDVEFGRKSQLDRIRAYVVPGEILYAVFDLKGEEIAYVGVTDRRLILYNRAFAHRQEAMVSVPYSQVSSFAVAESEGPPFSVATLYLSTTGGRSHALAFVSTEKARRAYALLAGQILQQEAAG